MDIKVFVAFLAAFCLAQALTPEEAHAQYAIVKYASEATIFRMRAYSVALEMNYSVKLIDQQIIAKMLELAIDAAVIDDLKAKMIEKSTTINENILRIMDYAASLITVLETTNNNIVNDPTLLNVDLVMINAETNNVNLAFDLGSSNIELSIELIRLKITTAISGAADDDPIKVEILTLMTDAETILQAEYDAMTASKVVFDAAYTETKTSMETLLATKASGNKIVPLATADFQFNMNSELHPNNLSNILSSLKTLPSNQVEKNSVAVPLKYHPRNLLTTQS